MDQEIYEIVEKAIDFAIEGKYYLNLYKLLQSNKSAKSIADNFLESSVSIEIRTIAEELEYYLEGGQDEQHKQLKEAYGHLGNPHARKIMNYLQGFLDDARRYSNDRKPGRKRKQSK